MEKEGIVKRNEKSCFFLIFTILKTLFSLHSRTMNSTELQKKFPDVYRDFFSKNDLVVSGCFSMSWGPGGIGHRSDYIRIKSKVPLKCYIGIKKRTDNVININNVISYDFSNKKFDNFEFIKVNPEKEKIIFELSKVLKKYSFNSGFDVSFLSETTRGHSFGFSGVAGSLMAIGIYLLIGKIDKKELIQKYDDFLSSEIFKEISSLSWKLDMISTYGNTAGHSALNVFFKTKYPTYLFTEKFNSDIEIDKLDEIKRFHQIIYEKFQSTSITGDITMDYGIIFSGIPTHTKKIEELKRGQSKKYDLYGDFIKNELFEEKDLNIDNISFGKYSNENSIYKSLSEIISILGIKSVYLLKKNLEHGYESNIIEEFIDVINQYRYAISLIEKQNSFGDDFVYFFNRNKINNEEKIGIVPIYGGKLGGGYLFVTKPGISINTMDKTISDLKNIYQNTEIEYSSHYDGECSDGVVLEQNISDGFYSKYVDKNKVIYKDNKGNSYLGDYGELIEKENDGLLFDMINNKIYLNGEKLTSKNIPSQNTTIEVVSKLLENIGEEISNKELPASSYTSNKNEMLGKIILPLLKLVEEKTSEQLSIVCKGSITDFYIKIGEINLKIGTIKKI
ncbi:hypothetical protein AUJ87_04060 [Candidatus Gracilibacteria bacterium CG1_02_38_174]|nr:MAG: hypothetical protein AUJ87_04060 [Candidatus Gracilibacteria bacterium CG1_02_38_174]PIQ12115.1 MAG: hypothetical protein COW68_00885 [Candidatus Gracilibacteria bacterium CG18_big_fil_WC_8_21_14_2_50_38_16]PIQ41304.1 MAG: hypothetical protein COW06_03260 [Candidatus Gracilibacteria bacterium CG12_big_fil_rev_8_21_14_0_65_38_15]